MGAGRRARAASPCWRAHPRGRGLRQRQQLVQRRGRCSSRVQQERGAGPPGRTGNARGVAARSGEAGMQHLLACHLKAAQVLDSELRGMAKEVAHHDLPPTAPVLKMAHHKMAISWCQYTAGGSRVE